MKAAGRRIDAIAATALILSPTMAHRLGPNGLKIQNKTSHDLVRWPRVPGKAPEHLKTPVPRRCFVTVLAMPLECRPSNCLASKLPSHLSNNGTMPRRKNNQTRQPGAQKPQPGPLPTGPVLKR